jgi:hypothetical protein
LIGAPVQKRHTSQKKRAVDSRAGFRARAVATSTVLFQQVTWKSPIFLACDLLNTWIASGVGCNRTLQSFFAK